MKGQLGFSYFSVGFWNGIVWEGSDLSIQFLGCCWWNLVLSKFIILHPLCIIKFFSFEVQHCWVKKKGWHYTVKQSIFCCQFVLRHRALPCYHQSLCALMSLTLLETWMVINAVPFCVHFLFVFSEHGIKFPSFRATSVAGFCRTEQKWSQTRTPAEGLTLA